MANTARQFVEEERELRHDSILTNCVRELGTCLKNGVDRVCIHGAWLPVLWKASKLTQRYGAELYIRPAGSYDPVRLAYHAWKKRFVSWFEHRMLSRADVLLATCDAEVEWIRSYAPLVKKIEITDLKRFFNLSRAGNIDHVENGEVHLLYLGRRHSLKGVEYFEEAVKQVQNNSATQRLCVKIISSAFGEEKEKIWEWCDVLVLPTLSENFGRVIAEALERGKRVITTDGAPAWGGGCLEFRVQSLEFGGEIWSGYNGRLIYLKGYRDGTNDARLSLLRDAIEQLIERRQNV